MKLRNIESSLDRMNKTSRKIKIKPNGDSRIIKYGWFKKLIIKLFKLC
jgi:hypothetical protein